MDLKDLLMTDIVGESMDKKTFWEQNTQGIFLFPFKLKKPANKIQSCENALNATLQNDTVA